MFFAEGHFEEEIYPFLIKPKFSTPGSIVEISTKQKQKLVLFKLRDGLLGFDPNVVL